MLSPPAFDPRAFDAQALARAFALAPKTLTRLERLAEGIQAHARSARLMGPRESARLWHRHMFDSVQLAPLAPWARVWADLGSGAGLPGLALACVLAEGGSAWSMTLIERAPRRADFLDAMCQTLGLADNVVVARTEAKAQARRWGEARHRPDIVCARAFAPLREVVALARPALEGGARVLVLAGRGAWSEQAALTTDGKSATLSEPRRVGARRVGVCVRPSRTDPTSGILELRCVP